MQQRRRLPLIWQEPRRTTTSRFLLADILYLARTRCRAGRLGSACLHLPRGLGPFVSEPGRSPPTFTCRRQAVGMAPGDCSQSAPPTAPWRVESVGQRVTGPAPGYSAARHTPHDERASQADPQYRSQSRTPTVRPARPTTRVSGNAEFPATGEPADRRRNRYRETGPYCEAAAPKTAHTSAARIQATVRQRRAICSQLARNVARFTTRLLRRCRTYPGRCRHRSCPSLPEIIRRPLATLTAQWSRRCVPCGIRSPTSDPDRRNQRIARLRH